MSGARYLATQVLRESEDWTPAWDRMAEIGPEYLEAFLVFRAVPQKRGPLPR